MLDRKFTFHFNCTFSKSLVFWAHFHTEPPSEGLAERVLKFKRYYVRPAVNCQPSYCWETRIASVSAVVLKNPNIFFEI